MTKKEPPQSTLKGAKTRANRTRLSPDARKQEVIQEAILYFAEEGFDSGTRGLANRLNITQPLLYRYFPSKDDLINEVYRTVYLDRWQEDWEETIRDPRLSIEDRLLKFYKSYTNTVFDRNWIRIFLFSGLKGLDLNSRYLQRVEKSLLSPIWTETCKALGRLDLTGEEEVVTHNLVWLMHGAIFYHGIREKIYGDHTVNTEETIKLAVGTYLISAKSTLVGRQP